ncbi:hypothetical protein [Proteiniphilum propionicum]|jgi:hypothetical protein|uniref:hypothetical protein n=1 Tax=Proteiniphilum propionicum TaxID=2829812 RepID=UPI001EEB5D78|nr:hypothetical protein [Proteiniphilum propionicum]MDD4425996.1 hypothetical protein [Mariniphaga sp.]ULB35721.1 hypothetical protein KDN43_06775 [Proteiniphilum propionicum]
MLTILIIAVLSYVVFVASYVLWIHMDKRRESGNDKYPPSSSGRPSPNNDIIGKSKFILPVKKIPETSPAKVETSPATSLESEKEAEKSNNFVSSKPEGNVPEHEKVTEETDNNPPLPIEEKLEFEGEGDEEESEEVEGLHGAFIASGLTFEDMGHAVTVVIHRPEATPEECLQAGKTLSRLENTELFEKLASSEPGRRDIISELMDFHLKDYLAGVTDRKSRQPKEVPDGFDINDLVQQINN